MKSMIRWGLTFSRFVLVLLLAMMILGRQAALAQWDGQPDGSQVTPDPWPKVVKQANATYTLYQPQLDSWDGYHFNAHAAVSVLPSGAKDPQFGVIEITANTHVFRIFRTVHFSDITVTKATFPGAPTQAIYYQDNFQTMVSGGASTMSLDRLQAMLSIENALKMGKSVPVKNDPPKIVFSPRTGILVSIDGDAKWGPVAGTSLERVINSRALVLLDDKSGKYYIHIFDGFVESTALTGPWTAAKQVPPGAAVTAQVLAKQRIVDLLSGPADKKLSLATAVPDVIVATTPTEIVISDGAPDWAPLDGTNLLYVKNTTGNVFKDLNDQNTYVLVTGRWFRAADFAGPWQYVPGASLPADFFKIPDDSPKENVKAAIPKTAQAQEAVIANEVPQTATVYRAKASFTPVINGAPELKPIENTSLMYVFNSPMPIIMVSQYEWYAVHNGVWFTASAAQGPWVVATSIPAAIYSIPPSSPLYYVTYVKIYDVTPQVVVVGYTPGYMGTVVTTDGVVVYGTGYTYVPYIGASVWYAPPVTYGYAANPTWTPWTGWMMGFGFGWAMGAMASSGCCWGYAAAPYWGAMPYAPYGGYHYSGYAYGPYGGAAAWGPNGWAATSGNVYSHWGATSAVSRSSAGYNAWTGNAWANRVGTSYNSVTGRVSAGQRAGVQNVYTGNYAYGQRGATYNPSTGVAARGGSVTYGNAYTGQQQTARGAQVSGPRGNTAGVAQVGNDTYADHDGNVYRNTGSGWQTNSNGSWNSVQNSAKTQSLDNDAASRYSGDQRSAASSWGSRSWGGGFSGGGDSSGFDRSGGGGGLFGGGGFGGGGGGGGLFGGGGWDRGGGGFGGGGFGGGGRSWGGGSFGGFGGGRFGGGGFGGGGFRGRR